MNVELSLACLQRHDKEMKHNDYLLVTLWVYSFGQLRPSFVFYFLCLLSSVVQDRGPRYFLTKNTFVKVHQLRWTSWTCQWTLMIEDHFEAKYFLAKWYKSASRGCSATRLIVKNRPYATKVETLMKYRCNSSLPSFFSVKETCLHLTASRLVWIVCSLS